MAISFDFVTKRIILSSPQTSLLMQDLLNACRAAEESDVGITYPQIVAASGKEPLASGVAVGITLQLLGMWQLQWWAGNYQASVSGGNLVAQIGNPIAFVVNGPQVVVTESAAATLVSVGSGVLPSDITALKDAVWADSRGKSTVNNTGLIPALV